MNIDAGQAAYSDLPDADRPGPSGVMTVAEEEKFWRTIREDYPTDPEADTSGPAWLDDGAEPSLGLLGGPCTADTLRTLDPSGFLVDVLDAIGEGELDSPERFDDLALLEVVAAWQRVASMAAAGAARAAAALSRRDCLQVPDGPLQVGRGHRRYTTLRATGTEIAIRTGCTVRSGELLTRDGLLFDGVLAVTGCALARGQIDARKARMIADRLDGAPLETALDVQAQILPEAGLRSPVQLERDLTRALLEVDTEEAAARHRRARRDRRACRPRILPDGMAGIWAVLPAEAAAVLDAALDAVAASGRAAGDRRTADQLRADGLLELVVGTPGVTGRRPGPGSDPTAGAGAGAGAGARTAVSVHVGVTVALSTLLGLDDAPGELAGYGAITAEQAAALAAGGALRRIVTDPLTGAVLDLGRTRYRPPAALRAHVIARDRTCARPGCVVPAQRAELDHTVPFGTSQVRAGADGRMSAPGGPPQGDTAAHNLAPLCAPGHLAKTLGVLRLAQPAPGVLEWTTATGLRARVVPGRDGAVTLLPVHPAEAPQVGASPPF